MGTNRSWRSCARIQYRTGNAVQADAEPVVATRIQLRAEVNRFCGRLRPSGDKLAEPWRNGSDQAPIGITDSKNVSAGPRFVNCRKVRRQFEARQPICTDRHVAGGRPSGLGARYV
jgi:hypothetical protein